MSDPTPIDPALVCSICGKDFARGDSLRRHRKQIHKVVEIFICQQPDCGQTFTCYSHYHKHICNDHDMQLSHKPGSSPVKRARQSPRRRALQQAARSTQHGPSGGPGAVLALPAPVAQVLQNPYVQLSPLPSLGIPAYNTSYVQSTNNFNPNPLLTPAVPTYIPDLQGPSYNPVPGTGDYLIPGDPSLETGLDLTMDEIKALNHIDVDWDALCFSHNYSYQELFPEFPGAWMAGS
ncbi:hypothetical protein F5Y08DRAFT_346294 [Xylaria arbuscula]|nr:hypothetical protein F5Y08DRAFT_346294 [Xylaria arbuscula]